jgi:hypothetical protein
MSNTRVHYEMATREGGGGAALTGRGGGVEAPSLQLNGEGGSSC